jgi:hypothetical protein
VKPLPPTDTVKKIQAACGAIPTGKKKWWFTWNGKKEKEKDAKEPLGSFSFIFRTSIAAAQFK